MSLRNAVDEALRTAGAARLVPSGGRQKEKTAGAQVLSPLDLAETLIDLGQRGVAGLEKTAGLGSLLTLPAVENPNLTPMFPGPPGGGHGGNHVSQPTLDPTVIPPCAHTGTDSALSSNESIMALDGDKIRMERIRKTTSGLLGYAKLPGPEDEPGRLFATKTKAKYAAANRSVPPELQTWLKALESSPVEEQENMIVQYENALAARIGRGG